jgi:hypothetical protein
MRNTAATASSVVAPLRAPFTSHDKQIPLQSRLIMIQIRCHPLITMVVSP